MAIFIKHSLPTTVHPRRRDSFEKMTVSPGSLLSSASALSRLSWCAEPNWQHRRGEQRPRTRAVRSLTAAVLGIPGREVRPPAAIPCKSRESCPAAHWESTAVANGLEWRLGRRRHYMVVNAWQPAPSKPLLMEGSSPLTSPPLTAQPLPTVPELLRVGKLPGLQWSHDGKAQILPETCFPSLKLHHESTLAWNHNRRTSKTCKLLRDCVELVGRGGDGLPLWVYTETHWLGRTHTLERMK